VASRIVKIYIFLVLLLVSILPSIYFILPSFEVTQKEKPQTYAGDFHFIQSADGYELFVRTRHISDTLPTLIFLTDIPSRANTPFENNLADSLLPHANLVFPDYRAAGKSERFKSFSAYSLENYVSDIKSIVTALNLKNVSIVGHGFGALVAKLASDQPDSKIQKLILINPTPDFDESAKRASAFLAEEFKNNDGSDEHVPFYYEMYGYSLEEEIGFFGSSKIFASMDYYKRWFVDTLNAEKLDVEYLVTNSLYSYDELTANHLPSSTIGLMYGLFKTPQNGAFASYSLPTLVLVGEKDVFTDQALFKAQADSIPKLRYKSISNSAHYPYIESPDSTVKAMLRFLHD
jgi:pimeloyl-ACP methyl ester carboxylesterase